MLVDTAAEQSELEHIDETKGEAQTLLSGSSSRCQQLEHASEHSSVAMVSC